MKYIILIFVALIASGCSATQNDKCIAAIKKAKSVSDDADKQMAVFNENFDTLTNAASFREAGETIEKHAKELSIQQTLVAGNCGELANTNEDVVRVLDILQTREAMFHKLSRQSLEAARILESY